MDHVPILDPARLSLITRGDGDLANAFLRDFIGEANGILARLAALHEPADRAAVADLAHSLKGIAAEIGAERLRRCAVQLETSALPQAWSARGADAIEALNEIRILLAEPSVTREPDR
jgi:HPt (histidine-containing phosphotransfer) domain-containing protein